MHRLMFLTAMSSVALTLGPALSAQSATPAVTATPAAEPDAAPLTFQEALQNGKVTLDVRLRYEHVDQDGFAEKADALTLRTRLGYGTAAWHDFKAYFEVENTTALVDDYADSVTAKPGYPVVMDPEVTEVNQVWLSYTFADTQATIGRQRIVYDNARFVGDVGWRQDNQTFDAVRLRNTTLKDLAFDYAWLWKINRVQGDDRDWDSNSHLLNASYSGFKPGVLTAYAYLLDFDGPAPSVAASTQTYGLSFAGSTPLNDTLKLTYRAEYAFQSDYADNPASYDASYYVAELGVALPKFAVAAGYEVLGADDGQGFRTPLGTVHAFGGWSDFALPVGNIPGGIRDLYLKVSATLPYKIGLLAFYHQLEADEGGADYGDELDLQLTYRINKNLTLLAKAAFFDGKDTYADLNKFWLQADYSF
ncbi:hypothetical protein OPIT5_02785 [Opitutaceae bacterium TAV5]|nr:hypothetical protein OPIT5_02785 [Opitutaceae bacterium TAV5]